MTGSFYEKELQKSHDQELFIIERVAKLHPLAVPISKLVKVTKNHNYCHF